MKTKFNLVCLIAVWLPTVLATPTLAVDLLKQYPTQLVKGDAEPEHAREWEFQNKDIFRLSHFSLDVGNEFKVETGAADLGVGHCADGAVWAVLLPREPATLTSSVAKKGEAIAHVWLRFHPAQIDRLFSPSLVSADGNADLAGAMRAIANAKMTSSWQANGKAMIPEPKDMTVYVDTKDGAHRFFDVDTKAQTARYVAAFNESAAASAMSWETAPPVVVKTIPEAGATSVPSGETEVQVTFSKEMMDQSWSWATAWENSAPQGTEKPKYDASHRTCALKVNLEPGKTYGWWLNSQRFHGFKDAQGHSAVPYLLTFQTATNNQFSPGQVASPGASPSNAAGFISPLNDDQQAMVAWTDRQFHSLFDARSFDGWTDEERATLERKQLDALKGPQSQEYYQAISSLAALHSTNAMPALRAIAFDRAEKDNRDRWMATRALGIIGDKESVPEMIHLLYHLNANTRWWAQLSLVRLTGTNFGKDWNAWGTWWNDQNGQPPFQPEIIRWYGEQPAPEKLAESLDQRDAEWLASIHPLTGEQYVQQQLKLAQAGNYWAKFQLWQAFSQGEVPVFDLHGNHTGKHEVTKDPAKADKWLAELVKGAYLAKFEPVNGFNPKTPKEMIDQFNEHCQLQSGRDSLGGASFFRTTKLGDKLIGSFLTATPDDFKTAIEKDSNFKLISIEPLTPEMFLAHEAAAQESL
jgi:RNA polymerase sigma-70 factor (ECF subfamily)